jgi:carbon storage regulator CsrA
MPVRFLNFTGAIGMLILGRNVNETVTIIVPPSDKPQTIEVVVTEAHRDKARLGITADRAIRVHRKEVVEIIAKSGERKSLPLVNIGDLLPGERR